MPAYFNIEVAPSSLYPLIWRRFLLHGQGTTFADLHRAIQDACGWLDDHLYPAVGSARHASRVRASRITAPAEASAA